MGLFMGMDGPFPNVIERSLEDGRVYSVNKRSWISDRCYALFAASNRSQIRCSGDLYSKPSRTTERIDN